MAGTRKKTYFLIPYGLKHMDLRKTKTGSNNHEEMEV